MFYLYNKSQDLEYGGLRLQNEVMVSKVHKRLSRKTKGFDILKN